MKNTVTSTKLILSAKKCIGYFRVQDYYNGNIKFKEMINSLSEIYDDSEFVKGYRSAVEKTLIAMEEAQINKDYILAADIISLQLLPLINSYFSEQLANSKCDRNFFEENIKLLKEDSLKQQLIENKKKIKNCNIESELLFGKYRLEMTNIGDYTVKYEDKSKKIYYHSNEDTYSEAENIAKYYMKEDILKYSVFGFGLGYHIRAMLNNDCRCSVDVIETNIDILTIAFRYMNLADVLSNDRLTIKYTSTDCVQECVDKDKRLIVHYPSLQVLKDEAIKQKLSNYFIKMNSVYAQEKKLRDNFYYNIKRNDKNIDIVKEYFKGKSVIYIGGGPSLEKFIDYVLRKKDDDKYIITCASTVYRTLISNNIIPDYVFMIDPGENMYRHFEGIANTKAELLYLSTASRNAVDMFQGEKYIIFQNGYEQSEQYATKNNISLCDTGGSVSTTAIDCILNSKVKEMITIGLDYAYTFGKSHSFEQSEKRQNMLMVEAVGGGMVYTTNVLNIYRLWTEKRIEKVDIPMVNLSYGAKINGMKNITDEKEV